ARHRPARASCQDPLCACAPHPPILIWGLVRPAEGEIRSLGTTLQVLSTSWRLLRRDGLVMFPLTMGVSLLVVLFYVLLAFTYGGTFERVAHGFAVLPADFVFLGLAYLTGVFLVAYFSAALIAAEQYRVAGGIPDFRYGLEAANDRLGALVLWSAVAATLGVAVRWFAPRAGQRTRGLVWGGATFLVLPVMMGEGAPPLESLRRS